VFSFRKSNRAVEGRVYLRGHDSCADCDGLNGFDLDVTCTSTTHVESGDSTIVYHFTSTAERGIFGSRGFVHRELEATVALASP
jgi:hypothetical protein